MSELVKEAREFALRWHGDQKYGTQPYSVHLDAVVAVLEREIPDCSTLLKVVAYLHDVLEDTECEYETIEAVFGPTIANAVLFCTDENGPNRKTRKALTYAICREALDNYADGVGHEGTRIGVIVKLADRVANLENCTRDNPDLLKMYWKESAAFCTAYASPHCDSLWAAYHRLLIS